MSELQGPARVKIHPGKLEEYKRLAALCMESVRTKDTGTLQYDLYFNEDQSECIVFEKYESSEALLEHLANLGPLMDEINAITTITGEIWGNPSPELEKELKSSDVRVFKPFLSM